MLTPISTLNENWVGVEHFPNQSLLFLGIVYELLLKSPGPLILVSFQWGLQIEGVGSST